MIKSLKFAGIARFATLALSLFASSVLARTIEESFDVSDGGLLKLETSIGKINIGSHNKSTVDVEVIIDGGNEEKMDVKFDHSGNNVTVIGQRNGGGHFFTNHMSVSYQINVPVNYNVDLDTSGGSITISDLVGKVEAHTSGGSIALGHIDGEVNVKTSGGSIDVDEVSGTINAHTSGGSVSAKISKQPTGDSKLTTSGGSITVELAANIAVDLSAKTSGGRVRTEFDVKGEITKKSIYGSINGGGPKLVLKTSGGSVRINKI